MAKKAKKKAFIPCAVHLNSKLWWQLTAVANQRGWTVPQLILLVANGVTRGLVDLDNIETELRSEGWWAPDGPRSASRKTRS
jgi:hypothetical protein